MIFRQIFEPRLAQYAYLLGCQRTREALVIDPQRDIDRYLAIAAGEGLRITGVAETHIHADFLSGVREFLAHDPSIVGYLSDEGGDDWSYRWPTPGDNVRLLGDGDTLRVGGIELRVVHTPGHTPEHLSFIVVDRGAGADEALGIVSGDFVFVGDLGRPDLLESAAGAVGAMEPSARRLYTSAQWFLDQADYLQVWPGHGAGSACGKSLGAVPQTTVGYERRFSPALAAAQREEDDFVGYVLDGQPEPPAYFARMKELNRDGPPVLGSLPEPTEFSADEVTEMAGDESVCFVDTRSLEEHVIGHPTGTIFAPLGGMFANFAGSYIEPHEKVVLIVAPASVGEVVRELVRIGLDRVVGFVAPGTLEDVEGLTSTRPVTFAEVAERLDGTAVLDVRSASEFAAGHLPAAVNIAYTRVPPRLDEVPDGDDLIVHCEIGMRAAPAASFLRRRGYEPTVVVDSFTPWFRAHGLKESA